MQGAYIPIVHMGFDNNNIIPMELKFKKTKKKQHKYKKNQKENEGNQELIWENK